MPENTRLNDTIGTADTIISDSSVNMDESLKQLLTYSTPEHSFIESSKIRSNYKLTIHGRFVNSP